MSPREHRLRLRIDQLLDRCEQLEVFLRVESEEAERLLAKAAEQTHEIRKLKERLREVRRQRERWKQRCRADVVELVELLNDVDERRSRRTAA